MGLQIPLTDRSFYSFNEHIRNEGEEFFMTVVKTKTKIGQNNVISEIS